jgi:hypothetical protein
MVPRLRTSSSRVIPTPVSCRGGGRPPVLRHARHTHLHRHGARLGVGLDADLGRTRVCIGQLLALHP